MMRIKKLLQSQIIQIPFKVFYINRKNLFKTCVDKEPNNCKIFINVNGNNIHFTIEMHIIIVLLLI